MRSVEGFHRGRFGWEFVWWAEIWPSVMVFAARRYRWSAARNNSRRTGGDSDDPAGAHGGNTMRARLPASIVAALALAMAVAGAAVALESTSPDDADQAIDMAGPDEAPPAEEPPADDGDAAKPLQADVEVGTTFDDESGILIISIGDGTGDPCGDALVTAERGEDGEIVVLIDGVPLEEGADGPEGCLVFDGTGKDGKVNHGTVVSSVAKGLSPHDLDVPKGWIMREVARSDHGKAAQGDGDDDEDDDGADAEIGGPGAPGGNGHGKPPHASQGKGHDKQNDN
jgi:hypothetical protein